MAVWSEIRSYHTEIGGLTTKVILALLGVIGATLGLKFVGSPASVIISIYFTWLAGLFLLGVSLVRWRYMDWGQRLLRGLFIAFLSGSAFTRTFIYEAGVEPAPQWYPFLVDVFLTLIAVALIISAWCRWDYTRSR